MENGPLHDDKLFRAVNERLSNYEAPYEAADWDAMSRALDQLPKTTRFSFKWKISLNSVLIVAGILGISVLGYALISGGKSNTAEQNAPAVQQIIHNTSLNTNTVNSVPTRTVNLATSDPFSQQNTSPLQNMIVSNNTASGSNTANVQQDASLLRRKKKDNAEGFLFGDQIDRRKGFIYQTQESAALINAHTDSVPSTYYDVVDGHIKKIHLNVDSTSGHKKPYFTKDSTPTAHSNAAAPTDGEQHGFDLH